MERCQSGLMCTLGKRVCGNAPQVQILSFPPSETDKTLVELSVFLLQYLFLLNYNPPYNLPFVVAFCSIILVVVNGIKYCLNNTFD